nr:uncharacterized protein LOC128691429 [Cherax quadricarinatus]
MAKMEIRRLTKEKKKIRGSPPVLSPQVKKGNWSVAGQHGTKLTIKKTNGKVETMKKKETAVETSNAFSVLPDECELTTGNITMNNTKEGHPTMVRDSRCVIKRKEEKKKK